MGSLCVATRYTAIARIFSMCLAPVSSEVQNEKLLRAMNDVEKKEKRVAEVLPTYMHACMHTYIHAWI